MLGGMWSQPAASAMLRSKERTGENSSSNALVQTPVSGTNELGHSFANIGTTPRATFVTRHLSCTRRWAQLPWLSSEPRSDGPKHGFDRLALGLQLGRPMRLS